MIHYDHSKISTAVTFVRIYKTINLSKLYYITFYKDIFKVLPKIYLINKIKEMIFKKILYNISPYQI